MDWMTILKLGQLNYMTMKVIGEANLGYGSIVPHFKRDIEMGEMDTS